MKFNVAMYGGTFDPVHLGHIKTLERVQKTFAFDTIEIVPCKMPLLKNQAQASALSRINMLKLAFEDYPVCHINPIEIDRTTPSYTLETLKSLQKNYTSPPQLTLIIGEDAFLKFDCWYQYLEILNLCNIIVIYRQSMHTPSFPPAIQTILNQHQVESFEAFKKKETGAILFFNAGDYPMSSTHIREAIHNKKPIEDWLPKKVAQYIRDQELY